MYFFVVSLLTGCFDLPPEEKVVCTPIDYGNGVYYFPCIEKDFGNALSKFKTEREVISIASDNYYRTGLTKGYFVITK